MTFIFRFQGSWKAYLKSLVDVNKQITITEISLLSRYRRMGKEILY
jgi:hypothetical protein